MRLIARMREASFAALISIIACFQAAIMESVLEGMFGKPRAVDM